MSKEDKEATKAAQTMLGQQAAVVKGPDSPEATPPQPIVLAPVAVSAVGTPRAAIAGTPAAGMSVSEFEALVAKACEVLEPPEDPENVMDAAVTRDEVVLVINHGIKGDPKYRVERYGLDDKLAQVREARAAKEAKEAAAKRAARR